MKCSVCYGRLVGPRGDVPTNMYLCNADDSLEYPKHKKVCIMCVYTHYRTQLLDDKSLKCYDPACKHSFDLTNVSSVAVCALSAAEYEEFAAKEQKKMDARRDASLQLGAKAAAEDSLKVIEYMAANARRCPTCTARVVKVSGCDDMTCQHCGVYFYWADAGNAIDDLELERRRRYMITRSKKLLLT